MLVALVAFEGCKDTKKDENKTPPPAAGGENLDGDANAAGEQDHIAPDQNKPKQKTPTKNRSEPATNSFKPAEVTVKVTSTGGTEKEITIKGSVFAKKDEDGDFEWMFKQPGNEKFLFVFNDDEAAFDAFKAQLDAKASAPTPFNTARNECTAGKGNAVIRPEQCKDARRAAGVPIGKTNGVAYATLAEGKAKIGEAIKSIRDLVTGGDYTTIIFSQAPNAKTISTGKVVVPDDVKQYIYDSLLALEANA